MKVIYLAKFPSDGPGVESKIKHQVIGLQKNGCIVNRCTDTLSIVNNIVVKKSVYSLITAWINISNILHSGNIVYCRGMQGYILLSLLLLRKMSCKLVFEVQSIEREEYRLRKSIDGHIYGTLDSLLGGYIKSRADGIVSVTNEIHEYNRAITKNRCKYLTLGNGIDVCNIPIRNLSCNDCMTQINVLCIAQVAKWHGIDRFIRGLHEYESTPDKRNIVLHIVGDGPELPHLKELTADLNLQDKVIFHGYKSGKELDEMFDMCHIAIGSLAAFRNNHTELSSLKSREYCARGIPFLMASKDADFPENWEYTPLIPANESPIDMNTVVDFANRVMADPEHPQKMRRYAEEHLDWLAKMKVLKEFLESL